MLKDVMIYGTAKSLKKFSQERPSAGKTGTTDDYRDAWFIGYTPQLITGIWVGYDKPRPGGKGFTGGAVAAPIWGRFMAKALAARPVADFPKPDTVAAVSIDPATGFLATPDCPAKMDEYFMEGTEPTEYCPRTWRRFPKPSSPPLHCRMHTGRSPTRVQKRRQNPRQLHNPKIRDLTPCIALFHRYNRCVCLVQTYMPTYKTERRRSMLKQRKGRLGRWLASVTLTAVVLAIGIAASADAKRKFAMYNGKGELMMPKEYRQWVFVGAPVTPNDMNNGKAAFPEFHDVYIDPASFAAYNKTGKFPDGTMLIKELASVGAKSAASGNGYFPGEFIEVEAVVKDSKRFAKEPGNWAYFKFMGEDGKPLDKAKMQPTANCNGCHEKNAAEDWVFTQFYPVLRAR